MAYNPRFPYTLRVLRAAMNEYGEPVFDENGIPSYRALMLDVAEYEGQMPKMVVPTIVSDAILSSEDGALLVTEENQKVIVSEQPGHATSNTLLLSEDNVFILTEDGKYIVVGTEAVKDRVPQTRQRMFIPFGYRQQTANAVINGDVIIAEMKIACPLILGDIRTKDLLELTDNDRTFRAEVVKKINTNFGTNIWYNEVKQ